MDQPFPFEQFLAAELESERCKAISALQTQVEKDLTLEQWSILALLPSRLERVQLASTLKISTAPSGNWALCTNLLKDSEQDVVGNAINSMTRAKSRSFAHRAFHYLKRPERPQRILYCLARYCEEADDRRIAEQLAPTLASDLSDAYLARSFNALYRHGIKSKAALKVALELVESHIDATNMDRKAAVAAITYLFFAGSAEQLDVLRKIRDRVTIPELRRLLNWGFQEITELNTSNTLDAKHFSAEKFWERNLTVSDANYSGYGCFTSQQLVAALTKLADDKALPSIELLTEKILSLGDPDCSNWLARHPQYGIAKIKANKKNLVDTWKMHGTQKPEAFLDSVLNPEDAALWHADTPELLAMHFNIDELLNSDAINETWLKTARKTDWKISLNIMLGIILAIENAVVNLEQSEETFNSCLQIIIKELQSLEKRSGDDDKEFKTRVLGCLIGTPLAYSGLQNLILTSMTSIGWWDIAHAFMNASINDYCKNLLLRFEKLAQNPNNKNINTHQILSYTRTFSLSLLNIRADKMADEVLIKLNNLAKFIEVLDPNSNVTALNSDSEEESTEAEEIDSSFTDWSGHAVIDRPIARWGVILEVLLNNFTEHEKNSASKRDERSQFLIEAMRTAPHVEKRWILRALASLGTDNAVKTILYQCLQHIDSEFVAQSIRELLPSPHPRAQQSLIRCVGRNAISDELKLNILEDISIHNPQEILQELRTLEILRLPQHIDDAVRDAVGRVAALIDESQNLSTSAQQGKVIRLDGQDVDSTIRGLLPNNDLLNVDSRSALRTAEMILLQSRSWTQGGMDLSPIVNMHCKAVELVLRDSFEPFTDALLRRGHLSRKLDILGYARPIPEKMQVFEDFLANLPVIRSIPYFSKFKLRKMLRGICLYRPGKRFTLDGPKAFALFFLVVSRQSCQFGLEGMLNLGFKTDTDLFEYIKLIHSLQDSRNRAVHEGLTWEAKDEIDSMRAQAFKIIDISLGIKKHLMVDNSLPPTKSGLGLGA